MLIYKEWTVRKVGSSYTYHYCGWFLFGIVPLIIRRG